MIVRVAILALAVLAAAPTARAADPGCGSSTKDAYALAARALTGPTATDVELHVSGAAGCTVPSTIKHVQIKTFDETGEVVDVVVRSDVAVADDLAVVALDRVVRGRRVAIKASVQTGEPVRTYVLDDETTSRLRPDFVVHSVHAPAQTLTTRPVNVTAEIDEINGDTGGTAKVTLASVLGPLGDPVEVTVDPGGSASVSFKQVSLPDPLVEQLRVLVTSSAPVEYDVENDMNETSVDVTKSELTPAESLVPSLGGYGYQFNGHLFAPITNVPPASLPDLEAKVNALEPQLVRIFYNENCSRTSRTPRP